MPQFSLKLTRSYKLISIMKLSIVVVCCFITTMHYSVEGGLVKDFFGKVKETAEVIHKDVHDIWRPNSANADDNKTEQTVTTIAAPSTEKGENDEKETKKEEDEHKSEEKKEDSKLTEATTPTTTATKENVVKDEKHEETTTAASASTTDKDGRANFSGACQANYRRTADGRCKPLA